MCLREFKDAGGDVILLRVEVGRGVPDAFCDRGHFSFFEAAAGYGGCTDADAGGDERGSRVVRDGVSVQGDMDGVAVVLEKLTGYVVEVCKVYEHEVVVSTAGDEFKALGEHGVGECLTVLYNLLLIGLEFWLQGFAEADGLRGDDVLERTALAAWEYVFVELEAVSGFCTGQNQAATWTTKGLVGCRSNNVCIWDG